MTATIQPKARNKMADRRHRQRLERRRRVENAIKGLHLLYGKGNIRGIDVQARTLDVCENLKGGYRQERVEKFTVSGNTITYGGRSVTIEDVKPDDDLTI